jgi:hypothetical protein
MAKRSPLLVKATNCPILFPVILSLFVSIATNNLPFLEEPSSLTRRCIVEEKPHDRFERRGDDLLYNAKIDLLSALAGGQFAITHLDGRILLVNILPGEAIKNGKSY